MPQQFDLLKASAITLIQSDLEGAVEADRILAQTAAATATTQAGIAANEAVAAASSAAEALASETQASLAALAAGAPIVTTLTDPVPANGTVELLKLDAGLQVHEVVSGAWVLRGWLVGPTFDTVQRLLDNTAATLGPVGQVVEAGGFRYEVVTTGEHVTNAGGVKLRVRTSAPFSFPSLLQFGVPENDLNGDLIDQSAIDVLPDSTSAISSAIADFGGIIIPTGAYRVTDTIVMGSRRAIILGNRAWIIGDHPSSRPTVRIVGSYSKIYALGGSAGIRCDLPSFNLSEPTMEGIIHIGQDTMDGPKRDAGFNQLRNFTVHGSRVARAAFGSGTSLAIDNTCGIKILNGLALPDVNAGSAYDNVINGILFLMLGVGLDCDSVVQGNIFSDLVFMHVTYAGIHIRGSGENAVSNTFFDGLSCYRMLWIDRPPLRLASVVGSFTPGETVTGGTSGATLVLEGNEPYNSDRQELFGVRTGSFATGEAITGGSSGATAVVDTTRWQYAMNSFGVGRVSQGNTISNLNGEPGSAAPAGVGGRLSRWVYLHGGAVHTYVFGRGNTGNSWFDYGAGNTVFEVTNSLSMGRLLRAREIVVRGDDNTEFARFDPATKQVGIGTTAPSALLHVNPSAGLYTAPIRRDHNRLIWTAQEALTSGKSLRFRFKAVNRVGYMFAVRASGTSLGSGSPSRHIGAEVRAHSLLIDNTMYANVSSLYDKGFAVGNFTLSAVGADDEFDLTIENPVADTLRFFISLEADNQYGGAFGMLSASIV